MPTYHLLIKGTVQGVFFRSTAKEIADKIGITVWIKNTPDNYVEAVVTGNEEQLNTFIAWCHEGPAMAKVADVDVAQQEEIKFEQFLIKR